MLKNKRSPGAWENLELRFRLQLQGKHGSGSGLQLQLRIPALSHALDKKIFF